MTRHLSLRRSGSSVRRRSLMKANQVVRFRKLLHESLENRSLLAVTPYLAVFNGLAAGDDLDEQADHARTLLASTGEYLNVSVLEALDLSGSFLIQGDSDDTVESLNALLQDVPGFQFVGTFDSGSTPDGAQPTRSNPKAARAEAVYGSFDYDTYLSREKNGEFPDQGGLVEGAETDALVNNNTGSVGTSQFTQSEISLVAFGNNVVIGFNDSGSIAGGSNKFTGFARSTDGGVTFVDGGTLPTNPEGDAGDPVLARHDATGRLYFSTLQFSGSGIRMFRSNDNGATWQAPVQATPGVPAGTFQDKQWHAVDNFAGPGNGNVYLVSREFGGRNGIFFFRSTDGGNTFGPNGGTFITSGFQGAYVAVGADHSVYAFWWAGSQLLMRKSIDQGLTFGAPIAVATGLTGGSNGDLALVGQNNGEAFTRTIRSNSFPHAVVNPVSGHIYVTYNNNPAGVDKGDVFMVMSTNGGATWTPPVRVNDDLTTNDQWQPTLAVTPDGSRLGIFYYSRQEDTTTLDGDPVNNQFKYYGRIGNIVGSTVNFTPSFAISNVASKPEVGRDGVVNTTYMGDYDQAVATPGAFHVTWADNRSLLPGGGTRMDPNVQYERISLGLSVTTTVPAVNSVVTVAPTVFTVNVSEPLNPATVDAGDLEVNGVAAASVAYVPGSTTLTFTYSTTPVAVQGIQSMHIDAGAFDSVGGGAVAQFDGQFRFDAIALQVTSTLPPFPNGVFTLPGPFTYDVNFNEPVNPASVQTSDLVLSGIGGAFVSGVTVLPGNTTARFTISGIAVEGALSASIAAGSIADAFGNSNNAFSATYQVDFGTVPYPVPLAAKSPLGSLIYDPTVSGVINFAGDVDSFTLAIDPNQTISVLVTSNSPGLRPSLALRDPANVTIGTATAAANGQNALLQTVATTSGGVYTFAVTGAAGTVGNYTVQITLNASLEAEGKLPGINNDSLATAQDINASFLTLAGTADRGAALGLIAGSSAAGNVSEIEPNDSRLGAQNLESASWSLALNSNIQNSTTIPHVSILGSGNGTFDYFSFTVSTPGAVGTFDMDFTNFDTELFLYNSAGILLGSNDDFGGDPGSTSGLDSFIQFTFSAPGTYVIAVGEFNSFDSGGVVTGNPPDVGHNYTLHVSIANHFVAPPEQDLYAFTFAAGERSTLAVTSLTAGTVNVQLLNSVGGVLATGVAGSTNLTRVISNLPIGAAGVYYARVTGDPNVAYSLVVTRNMALDTEPNDTLAGAQNISDLQGVLGHVGGAGASTLTLNALDSGWYDGTGFHGSANPNYFAGQAGQQFRDFVAFSIPSIPQTISGATLRLTNGLASRGPGYISPDPSETFTLFDVSTPIPALLAGGGGQIGIFTDLGTGTSFGSRAISAADNFQIVPITINAAGIAALNAARGTQMAIGGAVTTISGPADQLVFAFTGNPTDVKQLVLNLGQPEDWYSVNVTTIGDILSFRTSTPADGPGQFVNNLNPKIELFNPAGALVASGVVLPDGRNEVVTHTPLTAGTYRIRVSGEGGTAGEYFVSRNNTPTVAVEVTSPIGEGDAAVLTGVITDEITDSHTVVIDWGPGEASTTLNLPPGVLNFSAAHTYADDNPTGTPSDVYPISVTVTDNHGATGTASEEPVPSAPTELIVNGGFETGTFANWTVSLIGVNGWQINNGTLDPASPAPASPPIAGAFDALTNPTGPGTRSITQAFVVPATVHQATLSWSDRIQNFAAAFVDPGQEFRVQILSSTDAVLATVFSTNPGDPLIQFGPNNRSANVTTLLQAHAGQTLKVRFEEQDSLFFFNATIDNVSLQVVTSDSPAPSDLIFSTHADGTRLGTINPGTGLGTDIGPFGSVQTWAAAFDTDGTLYTLINGLTANPILARVNQSTGAVTTIGTGLGREMITLEVAADGTMYGIGAFDQILYRINKTLGTATPIGNTGIFFTMDTAIDSDGTLYATTDNALWTVDTLTGASTFVGSISGAQSHFMGLMFDADDNLFATDYVPNSPLYRINLGTLTATAVGLTGFNFPHGGDIFVTSEPEGLAVTVNNVAPVLDPFLLDNCIDDNGVVTIAGSFIDPGVLDSHQVVIAWGDGSPDTVIDLTVGDRTFTASHPYAPGTTAFAAVNTIGVSISDDDGGEDSASGQIAVAAGNGAYTLRRSTDGLNLQLLRGSTLLLDQPFDSIHLVAVVGAANKNDSLNVNGINGNPLPVFGVGFAGREGSQDTLTISNAAYDSMIYHYDNGDDGHVTLTQGSLERGICYDDLEQITTTATVGSATFNLPQDDNDAVLQRSSSSLTLVPATGIWAREPFVPTKFINPSGELTIQGRGGDDIVEIIGGSSITLPPETNMVVETLEIEMISSATLTTPSMFISGDLQINDVGRINGATVAVVGDVVTENPTLQGTATISLIGDGNQTLSGPGQLPHLDISKSGGTVTVLSDIGVRGNLTGSGGTFAPSAAAIVLQEWDSNIDFSGPVSLYNLDIYKIYTEEARLLSDLVVQGDLRVLSGGLNLGGNTVTVGGNMQVATDSWLTFAVDVAVPPSGPRLDVAGTLNFAANSKLKITTSGSSGPSVGGNHQFVEAGDIVGFADVALDFPAAVDAIFEDLDSLYLDLIEP